MELKIAPFWYSVKTQDRCVEDLEINTHTHTPPVLVTLSHSQVYSHFFTAGWKEDKERAEKLPPKCLEKTERGTQARLGGLRQKAAHLPQNLLTLFSLVPYQPGPSQSLVKNTNTFATSSCLPRSEHLTLPLLFPHTGLPTDFYDSCLHEYMSILCCGYFCVSCFERLGKRLWSEQESLRKLPPLDFQLGLHSWDTVTDHVTRAWGFIWDIA